VAGLRGCRLGYLEDQFEGTLPKKTKKVMNQQALKWRETMPQPELQGQFSTMTERNVESGRAVLAVSCWCLAEEESQRMWVTYVAGDGVAIRLGGQVPE
jgi:hypothetical protein